MFDAAYKIAFSHPLLIRLLVECHLSRWADRLDFSTLDGRSIEVVADDLSVRRLDLLFACRARGGELQALLLLELQGESQAHMATRTDTYAGLAVQKERRQRVLQGETPPKYRVLTLVLFHGDGSWTAPMHSEELHGPDGPDLYVLVLPRRLGALDPELHDLPALLLSVGRKLTNAQMGVELALLRDAVDLSGRADVDEVVVGAVRKLLRLRGYPEELIRRMDTMQAAVETYERNQRISELIGERRGIEIGERRGIEKGLCRMATRKFGPETARELAALLERMTDPASLDEAAEAIIDCDSAEALLRAVRRVATD